MDQEHPSRPKPIFFDDVKVFSTKKERAKSERSFKPPPSPHMTRIKSALLSGRVKSRLPSEKPAVVSFRDNSADSSVFLSNSFYDHSNRHTFLDQCFENKRLLGSGCFGNVFSVRSKLDGRMYAVKQSRQPFKSDSDRRRRLEEVRRQERLPPHRHCVRFYTAWEECDHLYMLTELCDRTLSEQCQTSPLPEITVWSYMIDLLLALNHLHSNRLMHLDVKPDNVFISRQGFCKLGDFGLVADIQNESSVGTWAADLVEGDPRYLAPELMAGHFSPAADIFSLGVSLLEVSSDLDVPSGDSGWHQLRAGSRLPAALTAQLSGQLRDVLQLMMEPRPQLRPSAAQLLELPAVRKHRWRRATEVQLRSLFWWVRSGWYDTVSLIYTCFVIMLSALLSPCRLLRKLPACSSRAADSPRLPAIGNALSSAAVTDVPVSPSGGDGDRRRGAITHALRSEFSDSDVDSPALYRDHSPALPRHSTPSYQRLRRTPAHTASQSSTMRRSRRLAPSTDTPLSILAVESADNEEVGAPGAMLNGSRQTVCDSPPDGQGALMSSTPASQLSRGSARSQRKFTPRNLTRIFSGCETELLHSTASPRSSRCRPSVSATPISSRNTSSIRNATPTLRGATPTLREATPTLRDATPLREATPTLRDATPTVTDFGSVQSRLCFDSSDEDL